MIRAFGGMAPRTWLIGAVMAMVAPAAMASDWESRGLTVVPSSEPLSFQVNHVYRSGRAGPFEPLAEGAVLNSGDQYKIIFTPDEDAYVYVFQVDSVGQVFRLFPMEAFAGVWLGNVNPVTVGKTVFLPSKEKAFVLDDRTGTERIFFLAFKQRREVLESSYEELLKARIAPAPQRSAEVGSAEAKLKSLFKRRGVEVVERDDAPSVSWRQEGRKFSVLSRRLEDLCAGCVHTVTFKHR